jgi:hypothetical protein
MLISMMDCSPLQIVAMMICPPDFSLAIRSHDYLLARQSITMMICQVVVVTS